MSDRTEGTQCQVLPVIEKMGLELVTAMEIRILHCHHRSLCKRLNCEKNSNLTTYDREFHSNDTLGSKITFQERAVESIVRYGVATISRLLKIIGLFCRISSLL